MKALVYTGPEAMSYQDVDEPRVEAGENLIKVEAVGICGSDMHAYLGHDERRPAPLILGHEAAGTVIDGPLNGKRVTVNPLVTCGECEACVEGRDNLCPTRQIISMPPREGAFAEFLRMPSSNLVELPDDFSIDKAALAEPLAVCWHGVRVALHAMVRPMEKARCLVIGGGAIGLGSALALKAFGANDITLAETNPLRRDYLQGRFDGGIMGPGDLSGDFDLVIDAVGFKGTRKIASAVTKPGGVICHIGLGDSNDGIDVRRITLQEITFLGTYAYAAQDFRDTVAAMIDGRLGALDWIQIQRLSEGQAAFSGLRAGLIDAPKVVLHP